MGMNFCPNCFSQINSPVCPHCGYDQDKYKDKIPAAIPPNAILNNDGNIYIIGRALGQGGFGITYVAYDTKNRRRVAIKECLPELYCERGSSLMIVPKEKQADENIENPKAFQFFIKGFEEEAKTLYTLRDNKYVVNLCDWFSGNNTEYIVMDYIEGSNLKVLTKDMGGKISYTNALTIMFDVGSALMDVHRNGIVHRDISPENIMIDKNKKISLVDFGASRKYPAGNLYSDAPIQLKTGFAPPEQYDNDGNQGPWTDIYAFGATFYTLLSGITVQESTERLENDTVKPLKEIDSNIPEVLSDAIEKALRLDISDRYESIIEMLDDIAPIASLANEIDEQMLNSVRRELNTNQPSQQPLPPPVLHPYATVISGKCAGRFERLPENQCIYIGRDGRISKLVVDDYNQISRQHCAVGYIPASHKFVVIDNSTNGTYFANGERMQPHQKIILNEGDIFYLYSDSVKIRLEMR